MPSFLSLLLDESESTLAVYFGNDLSHRGPFRAIEGRGLRVQRG